MRDGAFQSRSFRLLFASRAVSTLGNRLAPVALAFAVLGINGSPTDLGLVLVLGPEVSRESLGGPGAWAAISAALGAGALAGGALALRWRPRHPLRTGFVVIGAGAPLLAARGDRLRRAARRRVRDLLQQHVVHRTAALRAGR